MLHMHRAYRPAGSFQNGDVLTVSMDLGNGVLRFSRNGVHLGDAFSGVRGPLVAVVTQASEESKVTIQNRPTVLNMGEYTGELRCETRAAACRTACLCLLPTRQCVHARVIQSRALVCAQPLTHCMHVPCTARTRAGGTRCAPAATCTSSTA